MTGLGRLGLRKQRWWGSCLREFGLKLIFLFGRTVAQSLWLLCSPELIPLRSLPLHDQIQLKSGDRVTDRHVCRLPLFPAT